jgi:hypothetical protein
VAGFRIDQAALDAYLDDGNGPVLRYMMQRGEALRAAWVGQMSDFPADFFGPDGAGRIVKRVMSVGGKPSVQVGTDTVSTQPHPIDGAPLLVFDVGGFTVFTQHVDHPGSDFTNYLTETGQAALDSLSGSS